MATSRPLPKALLKKMFLKVLYEHRRPDGFYSSHSRSFRSILDSKISEFFKIDPLTDDEYAEGYRAVYELERDGYIMQDPTQTHTSEFKILTAKGKAVVVKSLKEMKLPTVDIDQLISRDDLKERIHDDFLLSDFETAIFKAFRLLEELVRAKTGSTPETFGPDLMSKAFKPSGILKHPSALTNAEAEGLHHLMRGAIMWFKNPSSHRSVGYQDDIQAAHALGFANLLLDLADECRQSLSKMENC
jgi:uncharacterized protein (TIGR02391 family)